MSYWTETEVSLQLIRLRHRALLERCLYLEATKRRWPAEACERDIEYSYKRLARGQVIAD